MCAFLIGCGGWDPQQSYNRHEEPQGMSRPLLRFYFNTTPYVSQSSMRLTWTCLLIPLSTQVAVFVFFFLEGEVKERRHLMQLITELTATVFCLVCSKRSGTPLGKMRGLITVKLANEQVNHRTKFQYKDCHFSERCSCFSSKSLKKKRGRM